MHSKTLFRERSNSFVYVLVLRLIVLFFVILEVINFHVKGINFVIPNTLIMSIYYWGINSEENVLSKEYLLSLGLFSELLKGELIGVTTLIYLIFFYFISSQRRFFVNKPFIVIWVGFIIFATALFLTKILLLTLVYKKIFFEEYLFVQLFLTIFLYTILHSFYSYMRLIPLR